MYIICMGERLTYQLRLSIQVFLVHVTCLVFANNINTDNLEHIPVFQKHAIICITKCLQNRLLIVFFKNFLKSGKPDSK